MSCGWLAAVKEGMISDDANAISKTASIGTLNLVALVLSMYAEKSA